MERTRRIQKTNPETSLLDGKIIAYSGISRLGEDVYVVRWEKGKLAEVFGKVVKEGTSTATFLGSEPDKAKGEKLFRYRNREGSEVRYVYTELAPAEAKKIVEKLNNR
ncbi:MAG: hypothetical protein PHF51_03215 [Candidatus ainarchaeum sp.]|nr:hypothetical protein [Candidatus ainarchaeum sp.]